MACRLAVLLLILISTGPSWSSSLSPNTLMNIKPIGAVSNIENTAVVMMSSPQAFHCSKSSAPLFDLKIASRGPDASAACTVALASHEPPMKSLQY